MDEKLYQDYVNILREELVPAMGCTEPIAIAYAAALAGKTLGTVPEKLDVCVSGNIIKNVKSVIVPNTGGMHGIEAAAAAGALLGDADRELEVLSVIRAEDIPALRRYMEEAEICVSRAETDRVFEIRLTAFSGTHSAGVFITDHHTNVVEIRKDQQIIFRADPEAEQNAGKTDHSVLTIEHIVEFAEAADLKDVSETLERQIACNTAIAREGLDHPYGARIGQILLDAGGDGVQNQAKAWAAAGSDARMSGCDMPVVINSGSGNQGLTASLPVIVYAKELGVTQQMLYRALVVSNLVTIHLKTGIGSLSAYCGATAAGCGAAAGVTYLYGGQFREIAHTIVNAIAIDSGMICDGAKASCAAKIASAVEAGLLGMQMQMHESQFYGGDGIVVKGVENTIRNIGTLASEGMRETDRTIIRMMIQEH